MVLASTRSYWRSPASLAVNGKYGVLARSNAVTRAPSLETGGVDLDAHACAATAIVTITAAQMEPCVALTRTPHVGRPLAARPAAHARERSPRPRRARAARRTHSCVDGSTW